jgi:Na+/phosphate symporter
MRDKLSEYQLRYPVTDLTTEQQEKIREVLSSFDTLEAIIDTQLKLRRRIGSEE